MSVHVGRSYIRVLNHYLTSQYSLSSPILVVWMAEICLKWLTQGFTVILLKLQEVLSFYHSVIFHSVSDLTVWHFFFLLFYRVMKGTSCYLSVLLSL